MSKTEVTYDDYEAECLGFLADHFDKEGEFVDIDDFPRFEEVGRDRVNGVLSRFRRFNLIQFHTRGSIEILPHLFDVVEQLSAPKSDNKYDIFISYACCDSSLAKEVQSEIEKRGMTSFMAEKDIPVSSDWKRTIRDALRSSSRVLILLTPNSISRPWVLLETGAAWALDKTLIPAIAFVDPDQMVDPLRDIQARRIETTEQKMQLIEEITANR